MIYGDFLHLCTGKLILQNVHLRLCVNTYPTSTTESLSNPKHWHALQKNLTNAITSVCANRFSTYAAGATNQKLEVVQNEAAFLTMLRQLPHVTIIMRQQLKSLLQHGTGNNHSILSTSSRHFLPIRTFHTYVTNMLTSHSVECESSAQFSSPCPDLCCILHLYHSWCISWPGHLLH